MLDQVRDNEGGSSLGLTAGSILGAEFFASFCDEFADGFLWLGKALEVVTDFTLLSNAHIGGSGVVMLSFESLEEAQAF